MTSLTRVHKFPSEEFAMVPIPRNGNESPQRRQRRPDQEAQTDSSRPLGIRTPSLVAESVVGPGDYNAPDQREPYHTASRPKRLEIRDYIVGWICPMSHERAAASSMLDEMHASPERESTDDNVYTSGRIGDHNVVIAGLPEDIGIIAAASVAGDMRKTFGDSLKMRLLVGVGGGVPSTIRDMRLGDIVVSKPSGEFGGVVKFERGKIEQEAGTTKIVTKRTGSLNSPPQILLNAVNKFAADSDLDEPQLGLILAEAFRRKPRMLPKYGRPEPGTDILFKPDYVHVKSLSTCDECCQVWDPAVLVDRNERGTLEPTVWRGTIASGDVTMKNGLMRDEIAGELGVLCFEMEAAGLMTGFPCLVVRGICDYADSHKQKNWQFHAAMVAAAYAKWLLLAIPTESKGSPARRRA